MKLARAEILEVSIPLRMTFRHALASRQVADAVLLRVEDQDGNVGHGECAPRSYVTGETPQTVVRCLRDEWLPRFLGRDFASFEEVMAALGSELDTLPRDTHAAFCALELGVLDLAGRVFGRSVGEVLGPVVNPVVAYSGVVSGDGIDAVRKMCKDLRSHGFKNVKLKVGLDADADHATLGAARDILGDDCSIRVDANTAWQREEAARRIDALQKFRIDGVEQPLPAGDLDGLAWLTSRSSAPIVVDESLVSLDDARRLIERRACHVFNIRVSKCGGLINSARIRDLGHAAGLRIMLGAQVGETALLSAAGRHFATRTASIAHLEGSYGRLLLEEDIGEQDLTIGAAGRAPALTGPGLGVDIAEERLKKFVTARHPVMVG